jgi:hypothetical protein
MAYLIANAAVLGVFTRFLARLCYADGHAYNGVDHGIFIVGITGQSRNDTLPSPDLAQGEMFSSDGRNAQTDHARENLPDSDRAPLQQRGDCPAPWHQHAPEENL